MLIKVFLTLLLLTLTSANLGVFPLPRSLSQDIFQCYLQKNVSLVLGLAWNGDSGADPQFNISYTNAKAAGIQNYDAVAHMSDKWSADDVCNGIVHTLPATFDGTVWFYFMQNANFWSKPTDQRMSYIEEVVKTCQQHGLKIGVYSVYSAWHFIFGFGYLGSEVLDSLPLFYISQNKEENFNDYQYNAFGNWKNPTMKDYTGRIFAYCKTTIDAMIFY